MILDNSDNTLAKMREEADKIYSYYANSDAKEYYQSYIELMLLNTEKDILDLKKLEVTEENKSTLDSKLAYFDELKKFLE